MDLAIFETGDGGDLQQRGNDLAMVFGIENMPYIGLFGGNKGFVTSNRKTEESFDYWGNDLLYFSDKSIQFNSLTENALDKIPLSSSGRVQLENAMIKDLDFFTKLGVKYKVSVTIVDVDRVDTIIELIQNDKKQMLVLKYRKNTDGDFFFADFNDDFF